MLDGTGEGKDEVSGRSRARTPTAEERRRKPGVAPGDPAWEGSCAGGRCWSARAPRGVSWKRSRCRRVPGKEHVWRGSALQPPRCPRSCAQQVGMTFSRYLNKGSKYSEIAARRRLWSAEASCFLLDQGLSTCPLRQATPQLGTPACGPQVAGPGIDGEVKPGDPCPQPWCSACPAGLRFQTWERPQLSIPPRKFGFRAPGGPVGEATAISSGCNLTGTGIECPWGSLLSRTSVWSSASVPPPRGALSIRVSV